MWRMHPDTWGCGFGTLDNAAVEDVARNDEAVDNVFDAEAFVHGCGAADCFVIFVGEIIFRIQGRGECGSREVLQ